MPFMNAKDHDDMHRAMLYTILIMILFLVVVNITH